MCLPCRTYLREDGATHQILEDIGMMRMLPNMTVVVPADLIRQNKPRKLLPTVLHIFEV